MKITNRFDKVLKWLTVLAMTMSCFTDMPIRVVAESFDVDSVVSIESSANGADASDSVNLTVSVTVNGQTVSAAKSVAPGTLTVRANDGYEIDSMDLDGAAFNDTVEVQETSQSLNISAHPTATQVNEPEETEKTPEPTVTPETTPEVSEEPKATETPEVTEPTENPNDIIEITNELIFNENKASANIRLGVLGNPSISMGDILYNEEELTLDDASIVMNELDSLRQVDFIATKNGTYTFKITLTDTSAQEYTEIGAKEVTVEVEGLTELQASENLNKDQPTTYARNEITLEIGATANLEGSGSWTSYNHKWNQRSNDGGSVTISNASSNTAKITGKKAGTVTITHTWNVNKSETFIVNVVSAGQKSYDLYFYSLVPGKTIGSTGTPDSIWNGMGKGSLVGLNAPGTYANGVNLYDESLNITYPGNYPNINVAGKTYQYAAPGSGNETKEGYYTLEWIRLVRAEGANAGNNGYNPTVSTNTPTFHMDGQIFINEHNLYNVTFRMKMPGSDSFDIQEGYSILVPSGTSASTLSKPSTQDRTFDGDTYKFDGWYTDEACTQPANFNSKITENTNYYGKYVAEQKYTVTYVLNGGISSERLVYSDLRKNSNTPLINDPVRPGYVFAGWNPSVQEKVTADATYTAQWIEDEDITINYKATTGGNVDPTYETLSPATGKAQGSTATASAGYHFVNWTNASGDEVSTEAHFSPNKVGGLNVAATYTAHFEVDENQTKDLSYTVQHIVDGKVKDTFTESVTVQVLQPDTIARNEALEADQNYEGYVKVGTDPAEVPAQIENGAVIKVNYDVDSEQTKDLSYTVQHIVEGKVKDTFTESVTVQVLQPDTIARNEALEADQNYEGYVKVGTDPAEVPAQIENGAVIKVNYDVDSEQTKDLSYTVQHIVDGKVKDTFTETVTVQVLQPNTIARNEALEADQNYEGYVKVGTDPAEVPAQIENGAVIKVNYDVDSEQTKDLSYTVQHIVEGKVKDTFTESVTVQVLQPDTIARNEALEADQNYEGYVKVGTDPAEVPAQIENGAVIKVNYDVDSEQTKDLSYTVQHIVEGKVKDTFTETVTVQVLQPDTIARNEALEADQNYEGYVKVGTDPAEVPAQIENGAVIKVNYDVDSEQTKDLSYTVQHIVEGKVKDTFTETVTVQVLQPDTIARNEALEADQNYEGYVKVGTDPAEVPAQIENGAVIKVNYDVDSEQTKDLSYTVQHIVDGKVKDTFTETVTVQVLQPNTIARNEALEADQNYEGYVKVGTDPAEVPAQIENGAVIKVNYDVDSEQTKDLSYTVQHIVEGKVKDTFTETVTVQVLQPNTIARNEALEADQNYEGYVKVGTDPAEVPAQIENGAVIKVNYEVQSYNYKVSHIYRDAEDKVVEDLTTTSETRDYLSAISESPRPATSGNFVLTNVEVESQDQSTLKSDQNGNVTGTMPAEDLTITFNYSADENQDEIPDKYQITVTYRAVNGTITANNGPFTLNKVDANGNYAVDGVAHLTDGQIAKASPNNGYQGGTWSPMSPTTTLDLTDDTTFTITFTATPTDPDEPNPGCPEGTVWDEAAQACLAPFVPGPEPFVPGPGPVNPGPEEEVIVEPETPEQGGTATPTPTPEIEEIEEPEQPEVGHKGSWALINLIASLLGLLAALFLIFAKHQKDDDEEDQNQSAAMNEEDPEQLKRKRIYKWISGLTAVISVIVFVLTENMRLPMILVDKWTLLMVVFFLINAVTLYLGRRWHENEDDEEQTQA